MLGTVVGNYRVTALVSVGGMGTVYAAEHNLIGRRAAVKVLHPEFSSNRDIVNRFFNEAKATSSIAHAGIVEIFDFGYLPNGDAYIVMEFLEGEPLSHRLRQARMSELHVAALARSMCSALAAAHAKGIVHRDLKPDNIFIIRDSDSVWGERAKLLDFGIAKLTAIGEATSATRTGAVMGTPTYMAPEQCRGTGDVDARADLYSIGCVLFEMLTGRPPFVYQGTGELIGAHLHEPPPEPKQYAPVTEAMNQLVYCLLSKNPGARVQTAQELSSILGQLCGQPSGADLVAIATGRFSSEMAAASHFAPQTVLSGWTPAPVAAAAAHRAPSVLPPSPMLPVRPSAPTTLGAAAGQQYTLPPAPQHKPRGTLMLAGLAALAVAFGAGAFWFTQRDNHRSETEATSHVAAPPAGGPADPITPAEIASPPSTPPPSTALPAAQPPPSGAEDAAPTEIIMAPGPPPGPSIDARTDASPAGPTQGTAPGPSAPSPMALAPTASDRSAKAASATSRTTGSALRKTDRRPTRKPTRPPRGTLIETDI